MITIQNTNLISKTAQRRHAFVEAYFLTEHCGIMAGTAFHPNWTSDLLSWDQLQLHVAKSELAIFAMSQFLFLFFSLTPTNSINIPSVSKVRKSWEFYFFLFLAIYYLPNPIDSTSEIFLKFTFPFHSHEHWSSLKYFSNLHLLFFLDRPCSPFAIIFCPNQLILPPLWLKNLNIF